MQYLNEEAFEAHIVAALSQSPLYNERSSQDFDLERHCDPVMLEAFLRAQPDVWAMLETSYPGRELDAVVKEYLWQLNRNGRRAMFDLLHKGVFIKGKQVRLLQFKPAFSGPAAGNSQRLYEANRLSVVRQMRYSAEASDKGRELDLCILVNGIPIITCELKNESTGQHYGHGINQYRYDRNPENRLLRHCLVHFVIDNNYAFMTTELKGEATRFLPFNRDSRNPPIEGDYPTAYMWRELLQADSLLDLIEHFIRHYDEKGRRQVIFPRYHQLRAVRMLRQRVAAEGAGHNYLIQHSAGSGKTKSMAWLAHQLAGMVEADTQRPIFDSIIMVTDRIVLNRNMADDVMQLQTVAGTVSDIQRGSKNLATALNEGRRIIISTVQKFAHALPYISGEKQRRYAIIVDEAHTAIGNESAKDLTAALSTEADLAKVSDHTSSDYDSELDQLMAELQTMRRQMEHLSYFAFTATPKDKTFALFGTAEGGAHDLYSMRQAIDEKFILDVLEHYLSYKTRFELTEREGVDAEQEQFEEKKAIRVIHSELNKYPYIMLRKAGMMLDHFMSYTINKIGGQAKAMVVTDSRRAAADYKRILDQLIAERYGGAIKTLVAFSGEVEDSLGRRCTEANMNDGGAQDDGIRQRFKEDKYKLLIVAEKFQTGFDQPLLHTMYVDRMLGGIQCIQTLSRLNRCYPGKDDTMVVDFRNDAESIRRAFQQYYTTTSLEGEVETQRRLYTMRDDIEAHGVISEQDIDYVVGALCRKETAPAVVSYLRQIVDERVLPLADDKKDDLRRVVNRYVRQYGFLAQLMDFVDPALEKLYCFCRVFYKHLPYTRETLPMEILELIDLEKLRIQMQYEGQLELLDEEQTLRSARIGDLGKRREDEPRSLAEILDIVNSPHADFLNENDKILQQIWESILESPEISDAFRAGNSFDALINLVKEKFDDKIAEELERYYNFAEVIDSDNSLKMTLVQRFVEALAERTREHGRLEYDEAKLKERLYEAFDEEFADVCAMGRSLEEYVDALFYVLHQTSLSKLDGADEVLREALNQLYRSDKLKAVDKRVYFNQLVSKYEAYLKKLYYLIHGEEVKASIVKDPSTPTRPNEAQLADTLRAFPVLWQLRHGRDEVSKRYDGYLSLLRSWRNDEAHAAPIATEAEVDVAFKIATALYLFSTGRHITELEMAGY